MTDSDPVPECPTCNGRGWVHKGERPHMSVQPTAAELAAYSAWWYSSEPCPACWGGIPQPRSMVCDYCGQPLTGDECETEYGRRVLTVCSNCRGGQR